MRQHLGSEDKVGEIRMMLKHQKYREKVVVVVEGKTDKKLYGSLIENDIVCFEPAGGKKEVIEVVDAFRNPDLLRVIGIVDADFDRIDGSFHNLETKRIYITDEHDSEVMIVESDAFNQFVLEHSSVDIDTNLIKTNIINAAYEIGMLRYLNHKYSYNLNFKALDFGGFINVNGLSVSVDMDRLLDQLLLRSGRSGKCLNKESVLGLYKVELTNNFCQWQVCCGHDLSNIIARVYRQKNIGDKDNLSHESVEVSLRLSFQLHHFKGKNLYQKLCSDLKNNDLAII